MPEKAASSILRSDDFVSVDTNKDWRASIDLKAIDYGQFLLVSVICYDQNKSGLEERIITQDSDIFWTTYTLDLSGEGEGENQFPEGTKKESSMKKHPSSSTVF